MWPLGDKAFLSFLGKPLLYHSLTQLNRVGLKKIIVVGNEKNITAIKSLALQFDQMAIRCVRQQKHGQADAIKTALAEIQSGAVLICSNHDIVEDVLLTNLLGAIDSRFDGIIVGKKVNQYFPGGYITATGKEIKAIVEKPSPGTEPSDYVNIVLHFFSDSQSLKRELNKNKSNGEGIYESAITSLIDHGSRFQMLPYEGAWQYLKFPWHVLDVMEYYLRQQSTPSIATSAEIHQSAVIEGLVVIEDGVRILPHATVVGPCYIGKDSIIGNNALVRSSNIGASCVIGYGTEVVRSFVGDHTWFHTNYIGDSVIGQNVSMGAGVVLANIRLDESMIASSMSKSKMNTDKVKFGTIIGDNVRIGVNVSVMPGVKIGDSVFIGAGLVLTEDVRDGMFASIKHTVELQKNTRIVKAENRDKFRMKL